MKYKEYAINKTNSIILNKDSISLYRMCETDFTRNRKMNFEKVVMYSLNKKGLTSKMEIEEFNEIIDSKDISSHGVLKQRKKLRAEIYKDMMQNNIKGFYNEFSDEVKLFKGYIVTATDGSDFEIPNTITTRKNYNSTKDNTSVARAHVSNSFDLLNKYILSTIIGPEKSNEKEMDIEHLKEIKEMNLKFPIIRVKDRGYVSVKDIYYSNQNNDKFVTRLKKTDFKKQVMSMKTKDEIVEISYQYDRIRNYKDSDPEFYKLMEDTKTSVFVRIVKIVLPTGEVEILMTNLTEEEANYEDMNELYQLRWGIETNYHYLKESLKIETITSSIDNIIKQDIYSQMFVFNLLQAFVNDSNENIKDLKYKYEMKVNFNMAIGFFKKFFILIFVEEDMELKKKLMDKLQEKIEKYLEPVRPGRKYPRNKDKKNKHPINSENHFNL